MVYSYSVWQDEILDSLKSAGFTDIHRGNSNQKAVHIHPSAYKNLMEKIKCDADGLLQDIQVEPYGNNKYLVTKKSLDNVLSCKESVEKEMTAYSLAVEALQKEQGKVYNRQNIVYQKALEQMNFKREADAVLHLEQEAERLRQENRQLRGIFQFLNEKVTELLRCFKAIVDKWAKLRSSRLPDENLMKEIDFQIERGIVLLSNRTDSPKLNMEQR